MKTLLFDLYFSQPLSGSKFHGGGEYIKRVFWEMVTKYSDLIRIIAFYNYDAFLDDWLKELIFNYKIETVDIKNITELPLVFKMNKIDVFYTGMPYHYRKDLLPNETNKIATFHGMRAAECPHDQYEYKYMDSFPAQIKEHIRNLLKDTRFTYAKNRLTAIENYQKCLDVFDKFVCDSEHTKYSLLNYYPDMKPLDINVMYPPLKVSMARNNVICSNDNEQKYILLLGANRWIKNTYRGIKAIDDLYSRGHLKDVKTIVVGNLSNTIQKEIRNGNRFTLYEYVDDSKLEALYRNCSVFLYVTLNEGFGYPPLEAMAYGKTCVVSCVCSLPEICGNAVYYTNPTDIGEIQNRIIQAIQTPVDSEIVKEQYNKVRKRQDEDLQKLCELLLPK